MGLELKTPLDEIANVIEGKLKAYQKVILNTLNYVGEQCINEARNNGNYLDRTGNLRSSIGYVVIDNGNVYSKSGFNIVKGGSQGKDEGLSYIAELVSRHSQGLVLIVVAGMNYAAYVETKRNVISSAELLSESLVPRMLKSLGFEIK